MRGPAQRRILAARIRPDGRQVLRVCQRVWVDYHTGDSLFPGLTANISAPRFLSGAHEGQRRSRSSVLGRPTALPPHK